MSEGPKDEPRRKETISFQRDVFPGDTVHFRTITGSRYEFEVNSPAKVDKKGNREPAVGTLRGGSLQRLRGTNTVADVSFLGSTFGGSTIQLDVLKKGMSLEILLPNGRKLTTSAVEGFYITRPHPHEKG